MARRRGKFAKARAVKSFSGVRSEGRKRYLSVSEKRPQEPSGSITPQDVQKIQEQVWGKKKPKITHKVVAPKRGPVLIPQGIIQALDPEGWYDAKMRLGLYPILAEEDAELASQAADPQG